MRCRDRMVATVRYPPRIRSSRVSISFISFRRSPTDNVMECLAKVAEGEEAFVIKRGATPRENDHNGRHELHDVNAPPTARRAGLNLILIKSNKSADE